MKKRRKVSIPTIFIILLVLFYAGYLLVTTSEQIEEKKAEISQLQSQLLKETEKLAELQEKISSIGTDEWVKEMAREKLGLVEDGEIVYREIN